MMRLIIGLIAVLITAPASAGIDETNASVSLHESASYPLAVRFRIHCQPTSQTSPCGTALVDIESGDVGHGDYLTLRAAASSSTCTTGGVLGSEFDTQAAAILGAAFWGHTEMTTARKAALCSIVDRWW